MSEQLSAPERRVNLTEIRTGNRIVIEIGDGIREEGDSTPYRRSSIIFDVHEAGIEPIGGATEVRSDGRTSRTFTAKLDGCVDFTEGEVTGTYQGEIATGKHLALTLLGQRAPETIILGQKDRTTSSFTVERE